MRSCASCRNLRPLGSSSGRGPTVSTAARRRALLLAALLPAAALSGGRAAAAPPGVPAALAERVAERARARALDPADALAPVADAAALGLPFEAVANKILEGLAKGAAPERVVAVGRALVARLSEASRLLDAGGRAGLAAPGDRAAATVDLAGALADGARPEAVAALVAAAHQARQGSDAVVAAARVVGDLSRRGVPDEAARPLGVAVARRGAGAARGLTGLYDAWRAEGGRDGAGFAGEAARRLEAGEPLDGMVDWFGETEDRLHRGGGAAGAEPGAQGRATAAKAKDTAPGERGEAARGDVPGFDDAVRGQGKGKGKGKPPAP